MHWITDPWGFQFYRYGVAASMLAGALCGMVGVYVVLRRLSYIGHGLSHAIFGGAAASYVLQVNFYAGAGLWGFVSALLINAVARRRQIGGDAAIGIVTTASFAVGVAIVSRASTHRFIQNFDASLFGNVLGVTSTQLWVLVGVLIFVVGVVFVRYRQLLFVTFDPEVASSFGVHMGAYDTLFAVILAATVVSTMNVLGVLLIAAMIVVPAIVSRLITDSFGRMLVLSTAVGAFCGLGGMYASWYANIASGATIVLFAAALFVVVYAVTAAVARRRLTRISSSGHDEADVVGGPTVHIG
jgi:manganese/iron transport system permease protein/iron/zinc/copper transport system permease protein